MRLVWRRLWRSRRGFGRDARIGGAGRDLRQRCLAALGWTRRPAGALLFGGERGVGGLCRRARHENARAGGTDADAVGQQVQTDRQHEEHAEDNAGRFILSNLDGPVRPLAAAAGGDHARAVRPDELTLADRWIIARCDATIAEATDAYEKFRLNDAASALYRFLWSDLADWYIEQIKPRLYGDVPGGDVARAVAAQTFDVALRLLHPIMPFITETL